VGTFNPPIKGQAFTIRVALTSFASDGSFVSNPTISAGDFQVDKDGAGLANLATLPVVNPASSVLVKIALSATEMTADVVTIVGISQASPKAWADFVLSIPTA
jgi:hypothetical protein